MNRKAVEQIRASLTTGSQGSGVKAVFDILPADNTDRYQVIAYSDAFKKQNQRDRQAIVWTWLDSLPVQLKMKILNVLPVTADEAKKVREFWPPLSGAGMEPEFVNSLYGLWQNLNKEAAREKDAQARDTLIQLRDQVNNAIQQYEVQNPGA